MRECSKDSVRARTLLATAGRLCKCVCVQVWGEEVRLSVRLFDPFLHLLLQGFSVACNHT